MERFFKLKENGTKVSTEIMAGFTTFFTMVYIIFVNPNILSKTGMPWNAVFLATIISAAVGTLVMGLFANVPYAQAPGMGLNAFFTFTVCFGLGLGERPMVGSSNSSSFGRLMSARAMASICCCPPESDMAGMLRFSYSAGNRRYICPISSSTPLSPRICAPTSRFSRTVVVGNTCRPSGTRAIPRRTRS